MKLLGKSFSEQEQIQISFMRKDPLFEKLTDREISYFLPFLHERTYQRDEVVFFRDDPSQALYMVKSGMISLSIDIKNEFEKLMTLRAGHAFGDNALLKGARRIYTAIVTTESATLYLIPQINLLEIMDDHKKVRSKMMTAFAETYNEYTTNLFKAYQNNLGFFDLHQVYGSME